ncbi:MAG: hypothetical protein ACREGG_04455 [Candidatus Saccharimonadales bacterium]
MTELDAPTVYEEYEQFGIEEDMEPALRWVKNLQKFETLKRRKEIARALTFTALAGAFVIVGMKLISPDQSEINPQAA